MPKRELYEHSNPYATPEPHAKPGYTGYFPGSGPKRLMQMAKVYEQMTYEQMESHPMAGLRFGLILDTNDDLRKRVEEDAMVWKHETSCQNVKLRKNMMKGYTGHVPKMQYMCGKSYGDECKSAIALFEKLKGLGFKDVP